MTMATIQEVSQKAGVSTATVSRVLNNADGVKEVTRQRVLEVIKELNYHPNSFGRNLRRQQSNSIMVIIPDITNAFFSGIVQSIEFTARQHGYSVLLFDCSDNVVSLGEIDNFITSHQIDGVIFLSSKPSLEELQHVSNRCTTVLACEYVDYINIPSVSVDNIAASIEATNYLISLGHRDILFINPLDRERFRGYLIALEQAGIAVNNKLQIECGWSMQGGFEAMSQAINSGLQFTAAFCANDLTAIGAIKAAQHFNRKIPDDLSIVGFDGVEFGQYVHPALTTVAQPLNEIGKEAVEMWLKLHFGEEVQFPLRVPYKLTIRESCAPVKNRWINC